MISKGFTSFSVDMKLEEELTQIPIGDQCIEAIHWPGHSPGSLVYWAQMAGRKVLFGQDIHGPIHPALRSDDVLYQASLAKLRGYEFDLLLEGHFGIYWNKEDVREFIESFMK